MFAQILFVHIRRSVNRTDNLRFFFFFSDTHKVDLSLNPVIVSDNAQTRSDLGLHYLFASFSSNIQNVYKFKNNSVVPDQAFSAELI